MADINYWGLTGTKRSVTGITLATATVDTLITAIATNEGLPADYYHWSLLNDPSKNSITYGDSSTKLSAIGITDGATVLCTPQQNETKQVRQVRKLTIAEVKRKAWGDTNAVYYRPLNTLDITLLPDTYNGNEPGADDNPNLGELTLIPGVIRSGVYKVTYTGYHGDDVAFTDTATATATTTANDFIISSIAENTTVLYTGYLLATYTGTWTFTITSDDGSYLWIGNTAVTGYTTSNELASASFAGPGTGTISLTAGEYYPIRLLYGNGPSGGSLNLTYAHTGQTATNDFTGKLFSPGIELVVGRPWIETP
jgi:hypothetical protein